MLSQGISVDTLVIYTFFYILFVLFHFLGLPSDNFPREFHVNNQYVFLTFICPCIASISLKYNQQDATLSRSIYFYKFLCMFQTVPPPIIRSTKLCIQRRILSNQYCCLLLSWMRWNACVQSQPR
jgi:hypothetical protein